jgi:hypothetical protein
MESRVFVRTSQLPATPVRSFKSFGATGPQIDYVCYSYEMETIDMTKDVKFQDLLDACHHASVKAGWYTDLKTGGRLERNKGEMIALIHSELSEALEGERKNLMDDKLPHRRMAEVEMADTVIRILDYCAYQNYDLLGAILEKMEYNATREDHKIENRLKDNGKKY